MSGGEGVKLSSEDLMLVKSRIEGCLRHYMHKKEAVNALAVQDNIDPTFTEIIWQQLEEENPEFFEAYYLKLLVKDQILEFNRLLSEQVELMRQIGIGSIEPARAPNGSHSLPDLHIPTSLATQNARTLKSTETIQQPNTFLNCGSQIHRSVQGTFDGRKIDVPPSVFLSQNSYMGLAQTSNSKVPRSEAAGYGINSQFNFSPQQGSFLEAPPLLGGGGVQPFSSALANSNTHQHLNDALLDGDGSSFGFLDQSLDFPELSADDFPDLLESYARETADANNFVGAHEHGDIEGLDNEAAHLRRYQQSD